jgi:hypothetical protein
MKYIIIPLVIICIIAYLYSANRREKFVKNLKVGMKASYYSNSSKIKGEVNNICTDKLGNITYVEINGVFIPRDNLYP